MWSGMQHITDYRNTMSTTISSSDSLLDDLHTFYTHYETSCIDTERRHTHIVYTLFKHNCVASHKDNIILKFSDDTAVIGRNTGGDEATNRREVASPVSLCEDNNLPSTLAS